MDKRRLPSKTAHRSAREKRTGQDESGPLRTIRAIAGIVLSCLMVAGAITACAIDIAAPTTPTPTVTPLPLPETPPPEPPQIVLPHPYVHQVATWVTISGASTAPVVVSCPAGELALSGGWLTSSSAGVKVLSAARSGNGGWAISIAHPNPITTILYVECLANALGATVSEVSSQASLPTGQNADAFVSVVCLLGTLRVGGGFTVSAGAHIVLSTFNFAPSNAWAAKGLNDGGGSGKSVTARAECLKMPSGAPQLSLVQQTAASTGATTVSAAATCPAGTYVSGGGFSEGTSNPAFRVYTNAVNVSQNLWRVSGINDAPSQFITQLTAYGICVKF